jgi:hypothetical protein
MSGHGEYGLIMPFVGCQSQGGPYEDDAYVAGYEAGVLDSRLEYEKPLQLHLMMHIDNLRQLDLIAMRRGYRMMKKESNGGWIDLVFIKR